MRSLALMFRASDFPAGYEWTGAGNCRYAGAFGSVDIVVVDSVAALTPKAEIEGEMGDSYGFAGTFDVAGFAQADR